MKIIGIDLGTTNSCVAVMEGGRPNIINNAEGARTTPSVVAFSKKNERLVGEPAKRQSITNSERTISSIKRYMGENYTVNIDDKAYTPQEISATILMKLKKDAENYLNDKITDAVITVPAYFTDSQRQATKDAGRIAGLNVLRIINEPTAAALAYGLENNIEQKIMVYDLGGGTFDVSIIEMGEGVIEVLSTAGNNSLGGDDFDNAIANYIIDYFKEEYNIDLLEDKAAIQRIKEASENAKKELSSFTTTNINLPFLSANADGPVHLDIEFTRAQFNEITADLIEQTAIPIQCALEDAGLTANDIDKVLLVGGSTRMPAVQEMVKRIIGKEPSRSINPDECVAIGAAIQGGKLAGDKDIVDILLLDVMPLTLSIETYGGVATPIIPRNSTIPISQSQIFSTAKDNQDSVEIHIVQGERKAAKENKTLGKFKLDGIPPAPCGEPQIEVTFDVDVNGIIKISAKDLDTNREQHITLSSKTNMSEEEIERAIAQAQADDNIDNEKQKYVDIVNKAKEIASKSEIELDKIRSTLSMDEAINIHTKIILLQDISSKNIKQIDQVDISILNGSIQELLCIFPQLK